MRLLTLLAGLAACTGEPAADKPQDDTSAPHDDTGEPTPDADADGYAADEDCDDADSGVHPGAEERCDGVDQDCDGAADEDATDPPTWYRDLDGDGWGDTITTVSACEAPDGYLAEAGDCDDADAEVNPEGVETCDTVDNNCDGAIDEPTAIDATPWYADADGDGAGDPDASTPSCVAPAGYVADATDCDDRDAEVNPDGVETCDTVDNNCDGAIDEPTAIDATPWYADADGDGAGDPGASTPSCVTPAGYVADATDCDDRDAEVNLGAVETCNSVDDDCDGEIDEPSAADAPTWYLDADGDGHGTPDATEIACDAPDDYSAVSTDCDDARAAAHPGATETCDATDEDCDGVVDDDASDAATWYADDDGDGFGDAGTGVVSCDAPAGRVTDDSDCDDADAAVNPAAADVCDSADNDCDGAVDDAPPTWYADTDRDGYGDPARTSVSCTAPRDYVAEGTDCDDRRAAVNPGASERCDLLDNNCDGLTDDTSSVDAATAYVDADGDTYGDAATAMTSCTVPGGYVTDATDCDDADAAISPAATERCDGVDNDCDGATEGDFDVPADYTTIADAVSAASAGDLVCVDAGTYTAPFTIAKDITVEGAGASATFIDASAGGVTMSAGRLVGLTIQSGSATMGAALSCGSGTASLEDVTFYDNECAPPSGYGYGIVYLTGTCAMDMVDVAFEQNRAQATLLLGGLVYAYGTTTWTATGLSMTDNVVSTTATTYGGLVYAEGTVDLADVTVEGNTISSTSQIRGGLVYGGAVTLQDVEIASNTVTSMYSSTSILGILGGLFYQTPYAEHITIHSNTITSADAALYGGLVYANDSDGAFTWARIIENTVTAWEVYGGLYLGYDSSHPDFRQTIVAGNDVTATSTVYGGLFGMRETGGPGDSCNGEIWFTDIVANTVTGATIYGGVSYGDVSPYGTNYSTGWLYYLTNIVSNEMYGTTYGSVFADDGASYSYITSFDRNNFWDNTGTDFYNYTDPSGSGGNVTADPLYTDTSAVSALDWDLTLDPASPVDDVYSLYPDPDGSYGAMGAYGGPDADGW